MMFSKNSVHNFGALLKRPLVKYLCALLCCAGLFVAFLQCESVGRFDYFKFAIFAYCFFIVVADMIKPRFLRKACFWLVPVFCYFLLESFIHDPISEIALLTMVFNIVFYYLFFVIVLLAFKNDGVAVLATAIVSYGIGFANYAVIAFRENPILPWDLLALGTAAKVADNYTVPLTVSLVLLTGWFLVLLFFGVSLLQRKRAFTVMTRVIGSVLVAVLFVCSCTFVQSALLPKCTVIRDTLFYPINYFKSNGYVLGFVRSLKYIDLDSPDDYSADEVEAILDQYDNGQKPETYPNIIVVMNEAFSDLSVLGEFETNEPYMPYFSALRDNAIKGNLHVSVKGGNTANTEFEFLTGNSMAFLPTGSVPYELFLNDPTSSLASYLRDDLGYTTYAVHPFHEDAWKRNKVYPLLGFDKLYFADDFDQDLELIRNFASDRATYDKIIELYESREENERFFTFCVTLQNHGGYDTLFDNFDPSVAINGLEDALSLKQYLSLIKESDAAFQEFIDYFSEVEEPTVILMFGDHQPTDQAIAELLEKVSLDPSSVEDREKQFITPFAIWANYDIEEQYIEHISCNYLSSLLCEVAEIPLTPYQQYLSVLRQEYPVLTANCLIDKNGRYFSSETFKNIASLVEYSKVQYYKLFDS